MTGFFSKGDGLERELRAARPQVPDGLVERIEGDVRSAGRTWRRRGSGAWRVALPLGFTVALAAALAVVGGVSYAASSVEHAAQTVSHVFMRAQAHEAVVIRGLSSSSDQYRPGYGKGDLKHNHYGPPGLGYCPPTGPGPCKSATVHTGKRTLSARTRGGLALVNVAFSIDEQAHLAISITTAKGKRAGRLPISRTSAMLAPGHHGVKSFRYLVLIPRRIPLHLAIPKRLLEHGKTYYVRIVATGLNHRTSRLYIPFVA